MKWSESTNWVPLHEYLFHGIFDSLETTNKANSNNTAVWRKHFLSSLKEDRITMRSNRNLFCLLWRSIQITICSRNTKFNSISGFWLNMSGWVFVRWLMLIVQSRKDIWKPAAIMEKKLHQLFPCLWVEQYSGLYFCICPVLNVGFWSVWRS